MKSLSYLIKIVIIFTCLVSWWESFGVFAQEKPFCFVQITDAHIEKPIDYTNLTCGFLYKQRLKDAIWYINNVVKPAFVIDTGDLTTDNTCGSQANYYPELKNIISKLTTPYYVVPGNHDNQALSAFLNFSGGKTHVSFSYQGYYFIGLFYLPGRTDWENFLKTELTKGAPGKIILFAHIPAYPITPHPVLAMPSGDQNIISDLAIRYKIKAYLSGHLHEFFVNYLADKDLLNLGAPSLGHKNAFYTICLDNDNFSYSYTPNGQSPFIIITHPENYNLRKKKLNSFPKLKVRAAVFSDKKIKSVEYKIDQDSFKPLSFLEGNFWETDIDSSACSTGKHTLTVKGTDELSRSTQTAVEFFIEGTSSLSPSVLVTPSSLPTPTAIAPLPTKTPTPIPTKTPTPIPPPLTPRPTSPPPLNFSSGWHKIITSFRGQISLVFSFLTSKVNNFWQPTFIFNNISLSGERNYYILPKISPTQSPLPEERTICQTVGGVCCSGNYGVCVNRKIDPWQDKTSGGCNPSGEYPGRWCCEKCNE